MMYGPAISVGAGPGMPPAPHSPMNSPKMYVVVALLLRFLQQEEAAEAEDRHVDWPLLPEQSTNGTASIPPLERAIPAGAG